MTEEEKMLKGIMYNAEDESLTKKLMNAKKLCQIYNNIDITLFDERNKILKKLFSKTGKKFTIMPTFYCDYGFNIEIGENFYANHNLVILDANKVTFGDNVFIGPNCGFYTSGHPLDKDERKKGRVCKTN